MALPGAHDAVRAERAERGRFWDERLRAMAENAKIP
jgi:hypothetical protein